ncbi:MAG: hypothetical protein JKY96_01360, partial [Phycisphaerales bacterium]|nr:hypothetical protein [Phycisphaerales bacterium]
KAASIVRSSSRGFGSPEILVYRAGSESRLIAGPTRQSGQVIRAINAIMPTDEPGNLDAVSEQIAGVFNAQGTDEESEPLGQSQILIFTDAQGASGAPVRIAGSVVQTIVAQAPSLGNIAITALSAQRDRADPTLCRVFVRVQSTGDLPGAVVVRVLDGETEIGRSAFAFDGADAVESAAKTIAVRVDHASTLQVRFDRDDALMSDNLAWVSVPDPSPVRLVVMSDGPAHPILLDVLAAISGNTVTVIGVDDPVPAWAQLLIADGVDVGPGITVPSIQFGPAQIQGQPDRAQSRVHRIVAWKRAHPVLVDVSLGAAAFTDPRMLDAGGPGSFKVLASAESAPAIIEWTDHSARHLAVSFDLDRSNWSVQVGFAIFLANAVEYLIPGASGFGSVTTTDAEHPLVTQDAPDGTDGTIAVSLLSEHESNLSALEFQEAEASTTTPRRSPSIAVQRAVWSWFLGGAFVVMMIEWFLHAARLRV